PRDGSPPGPQARRRATGGTKGGWAPVGVGGGWGFLIASPGLTATAGVGNMRNPPKTFEEMHPGAYDAQERLKYMDKMGIWAMVMYPNVGGFGAQQFLKLGDPELMLTCVQIYNDWQTEWASV